MTDNNLPNNLSSKQKEETSTVSNSRTDEESLLASIEASFSGPLPPPQILEHYEKIIPGLANRIVNMAEEQGRHRRKMEGKIIEAQILDSKEERIERRIGQILGFMIGFIALLISAYISINGSPITGSVIGGGALVSLVSVFVIGRRKEQFKKEEVIKKEEPKKEDIKNIDN